MDPANHSDLAQALYVSFVTLGTLGSGDVVPTDPWVRMAAPLQGLAGFALLTTALTRFSQVYSPLSRRRVLALELKGLADTDYAEQAADLDPRDVSRVLDTLAAEVTKSRVDLTQHTESYRGWRSAPAFRLGV